MTVTSTPDYIISNTDISQTGTGPTSQTPEVVALDNGKYVVSWNDVSRVGFAFSFRSPSFQVRNADGSPAGDVIKIEQSVNDLPFTLNYHAQPDGRIFATWQEAVPNSSQKQTFAQAFDLLGQAQGTEFLVSAPAKGSDSQASPIALANGDIAVTWTESQPYDTALQRFFISVKIAVFSADSQPKYSPVSIIKNAQQVPDWKVTAIADGKLIASWSEYNPSTKQYSRKVQVLKADGSPAGSAQELDLVSPPQISTGQAAEITVLANGTMLAMWGASTGSNNADLIVQRLDKDGNLVGSSKTLGNVVAGNASIEIVSLDDGRYVLIFERKADPSNSFSKDEVIVQVYGSDGQKIGDETKIDEAFPLDGSNFSAEALGDGKLVVTWQSKEGFYYYGVKGGMGTSSLYAIRQTIVDVGAPPPSQQPDPDVFTGSAEADRLNGNENANTLDGREGNDVMAGGLGADKLLGGEGSDTASYFAEGGVTASLKDPTLNNGAAEGDTYDSIENLFGSNTGNDRLYGNDQANRLVGYGGNDTLTGAAGQDEISGGEGADRLNGGAGKDMLSGGRGSDRFIYSDRADAGDTIKGFGSDDYFVFEGSAFGLGSYQGRLKSERFESSTDHFANNSKVRFIFCTRDDTVWYDADGKGGAAAIMIADLTNNFDLKATDILIV